MSIISDIELVVSGIEELLPALDAIPLSPELAAIISKVESILAILKVAI